MINISTCPVCGQSRASKEHGPACARKLKAFFEANPHLSNHGFPPSDKTVPRRDYVRAGGRWKRR